MGGCVAQLEGTDDPRRARRTWTCSSGTHNLAPRSRAPRRALERRRAAASTSIATPTASTCPTTPSPIRAAVRAYVTAMEGCNHVCSFCVVPRTRGAEVCRAPEDIVDEVASLVARGYPEVMLLGPDRERLPHGGHRLRRPARARARRRRACSACGSRPRIPSHVDARLARALRDLPQLCPYLHLPVQSARTASWPRCGAATRAAEYLRDGRAAARARPDLALSSDVIVGLPGGDGGGLPGDGRAGRRGRLRRAVRLHVLAAPGTTAVRLADDVPERREAPAPPAS